MLNVGKISKHEDALLSYMEQKEQTSNYELTKKLKVLFHVFFHQRSKKFLVTIFAFISGIIFD